MPKVVVTPKLAETIKVERVKRNKTANDLAKHLNKSNAYITKLESAEINEINLNTLYRIFEFILDKENFSNYMENLISMVDIGLSDEEIEKEKWRLSMELQFVNIPVDEKILNFLKNKIDTLSIAPQKIVENLNLNEGLENPNDFEPNRVYAEYVEGNEFSWSIKFELESDFLDKILTGENETIHYVNMLGIVYSIFRLEGFNEEDSKSKAKKALYDNDFYTLKEKNDIKKKLFKEKRTSELSSLLPHDDKNNKLVNEILKYIRIISDSHIKYTNEKLQVLVENFKSEPSLTMGLIGLPIHQLEKLEPEKKRQFISDIKKLIEEYTPDIKDDLIKFY